jgi:soluble cytochrome b562
MKKIALALALLLALPLLPKALRAEDTPAAAPAPAVVPAPAGAPAEEKKTDLELRMDKVGKAFRKLRKQVADPAQNASSLELLKAMQDAAKEAVTFTPAKAADLPEDQRAKFTEDFKAGIQELQDRFAKLQAALEAGKNDDAQAIVKDLSDFEKKEHKEFKKDKPQ